MIYCFDLDNTLCSTNGNDYSNATPHLERIARVNELYDSGHTIIIETARGRVSGKNHFYYTVEQLKGWGLKFHTLRTGVKFNADIFVDDRAVSDTVFFNDNTNKEFTESGSGTDTKVILINRVRKEATNERMLKLVDEINFINSIPDKFKKYFPEIIIHGVSNGTSFYEMEHYNIPSMRRLIFSGKLKEDDVLYWMDKITNFAVRFNRFEQVPIPDTYMQEMHWDRFWSRKEELEEKSVIMKKILKERKLFVNGEWYENAPVLIERLQDRSDEFMPPAESIGRWSHADLHFSNILLDLRNNKFKFIDPRGYPYCDLFYDFGKLWHSVNGKYEMVVNDMWTVHDSKNYISLDRNLYFHFLEDLKKRIPTEIFEKYSMLNLEDTMKLVEFNEAMHFITLVPFQLVHDGVENRAKIAYFIGLELLNKFCKKYEI